MTQKIFGIFVFLLIGTAWSALIQGLDPYDISVKFVDHPDFVAHLDLPHETTVRNLKEALFWFVRDQKKIRILDPNTLIVRREGSIIPLRDEDAVRFEQDAQGSLYVVARLPGGLKKLKDWDANMPQKKRFKR